MHNADTRSCHAHISNTSFCNMNTLFSLIGRTKSYMYKVSIRSIRRTKELCVRRHVFSHHAPAITASTSWQLACMRAVATRSVSATHSRMSTHAVRCPLWTCPTAGARRPSHALGTLSGTSLRHERFLRPRRLRTRLWHVIFPIILLVVAIRRPWNVFRQTAFWAHALR